jgi:NADH dehydrogenase FAD-containing subunit
VESPPAVPPGTVSSFAVRTTDGHEVAADIWFRCFGARVNTGFLGDGALVELTARGTVPVDEHLRVKGHPHVYALGDIADLSDPKMATWAQTQALTVIETLRAQAKGQRPSAVHEPASTQRMQLTLGPRRGVGQMPSPDGEPVPVPVDVVVQRKGADLFTERFAARFTAEPPKPEPVDRSSAGGGRLGEV